MTVVETLEKARELVVRGWCQHQCEDGVRVCAGEAIWQSAPGGLKRPLYHEGTAALAAALRLEDKRPDPPMQVIRWNDAPERTQADVIAAFDRALAAARTAEGQADA